MFVLKMCMQIDLGAKEQDLVQIQHEKNTTRLHQGKHGLNTLVFKLVQILGLREFIRRRETQP